jgi:hypothetical protein
MIVRKSDGRQTFSDIAYDYTAGGTFGDYRVATHQMRSYVKNTLIPTGIGFNENIRIIYCPKDETNIHNSEIFKVMDRQLGCNNLCNETNINVLFKMLKAQDPKLQQDDYLRSRGFEVFVKQQEASAVLTLRARSPRRVVIYINYKSEDGHYIISNFLNDRNCNEDTVQAFINLVKVDFEIASNITSEVEYPEHIQYKIQPRVHKNCSIVRELGQHTYSAFMNSPTVEWAGDKLLGIPNVSTDSAFHIFVDVCNALKHGKLTEFVYQIDDYSMALAFYMAYIKTDLKLSVTIVCSSLPVPEAVPVPDGIHDAEATLSASGMDKSAPAAAAPAAAVAVAAAAAPAAFLIDDLQPAAAFPLDDLQPAAEKTHPLE